MCSIKTTSKWLWKMDYCKKHRLPSAQNWAWDKAEEAWIKHANTTIPFKKSC